MSKELNIIGVATLITRPINTIPDGIYQGVISGNTITIEHKDLWHHIVCFEQITTQQANVIIRKENNTIKK